MARLPQGLSFGTADEEAALRSLMGDETYAENLSDIRSEIKDFAEKNPKTALGLELVGLAYCSCWRCWLG